MNFENMANYGINKIHVNLSAFNEPYNMQQSVHFGYFHNRYRTWWHFDTNPKHTGTSFNELMMWTIRSSLY